VNGANSNGEIRQMKIFSASVSFTVPAKDFLVCGAALGSCLLKKGLLG